MKLMTRIVAVCVLIGFLVPCMAEESGRGVGFVLKIDAGTVVNDPAELVELVGAYGSQEDSLNYRVRVNNANLRESPYSLSVFVEEISSDVANASAFAQDLVKYMGQTMETFFEQTHERLDRRLTTLTNQKQRARERLASLRAGISGAAKISPVVQSQLDTKIDLIDFSPELPASAAFEILRESVSPPVNIIVLWKDLFENAEVEPTTPIDMDGVSAVSMGTALDILLKALGGGFYELAYTVQDSVVVVATEETLGVLSSGSFLDLASAEYTSTLDINQQRRKLINEIDKLEMDIARQQSSKSAIEREISQIRAKINEALASDSVLKDFESLVAVMQTNLEAIKNKDPEEYVGAMERMVSLRMKVAEHKARLVRQTGGEDLARFNKEALFSGGDLAGDMAELSVLKRQLTRVEKELAQSVRLRSAVNEIKTTEEALADIDVEIAHFQTLMASLEEPSVTCLGL
jgi:chaperonin cofactor prefoldin